MEKRWLGQDDEEADASWRVIGRNLGLRFEDSTLSGIWENHQISISLISLNLASLSHVHTVFELFHNDYFTSSFQLTRQGLLENIFTKTGQQDIQIGDRYFDEKVLVKGWDEDKIRELLLDDSIRRTCLGLLLVTKYSEVEITHERAAVSVPGIETDPLKMVSVLFDLLSVAKAFDVVEEEDVVVPVEAEPIVVKEKVVIETPVPDEEVPVGPPTCRVVCILPAPSGKGWEVTGRANDGLLSVSYRIGDARKERFESEPGDLMVLEGDFQEFDSESRTVVVDSGDTDHSPISTSAQATVVIKI